MTFGLLASKALSCPLHIGISTPYEVMLAKRRPANVSRKFNPHGFCDIEKTFSTAAVLDSHPWKPSKSPAPCTIHG